MKSLCKQSNRKAFYSVYEQQITSEVKTATRYFTAWLALILFKRGWSTESVGKCIRAYNNWFRAVNNHTADNESGCTLDDIKAELKSRYGYEVTLSNSLIPDGAAQISDAVGYSMDVCLNLLATTAALTLFDLDRPVGTVNRTMQAFDARIKFYKAGDKDYQHILSELRNKYHFCLELEVS